jgi:hypothetical protein
MERKKVSTMIKRQQRKLWKDKRKEGQRLQQLNQQNKTAGEDAHYEGTDYIGS